MIKITISKFNHNTTSPPFDVLIERKSSSPFCPVQALLNYCKNRDHHPGPLFCHSSVSPITVSEFSTNLQRCLIFYGPDTSGYKGHSFRMMPLVTRFFWRPDSGASALEICCIEGLYQVRHLACHLTKFLASTCVFGSHPRFSIVSFNLTVVRSMWRVR